MLNLLPFVQFYFTSLRETDEAIAKKLISFLTASMQALIFSDNLKRAPLVNSLILDLDALTERSKKCCSECANWCIPPPFFGRCRFKVKEGIFLNARYKIH